MKSDVISTTCVVGFLISTTCVAKCPRSPLFILLEFDTRVMLHAANAVSHGYQRILIIATDTDINRTRNIVLQ